MKPSYSIPGRVRQLEDPSGLPMVELSNDRGRARLCLQGAQVIDYRLQGQPPILWLSRRARFEPGQAIRGGIPICWPWFGDHPERTDLPAHGLARTRLWQVVDSYADSAVTGLRLTLEDDEQTRQLWPLAFRLELQVELDESLHLTLTTHNPNPVPMRVSEALHSYLAVGDLHRVQVHGLEGGRYRDKLDALKSKSQGAPLAIRGETDRVYLDTEAEVSVDDPELNRRLLVQKSGSRSTVIWNPGREKSAKMADMDDGGYRRMLCVETANALGNTREIAPDECHSLTTRIQSSPLEPRWIAEKPEPTGVGG